MNVLLPNALAVPVTQEEILTGRIIFRQFLHQNFEEQGVDEEILVEEDDINQMMAGDGPQVQVASNPEQFLGNRPIQIGRQLNLLAKEFERSIQRQAVRQHADEVDLASLTYDNFWNLLNEVFLEGVTGSNIVALFTFCSDVLIRCVRNNLRNIGLNLFRWAVEYLVNRVIEWVVAHGGWEAVLRKAWDIKIVRYLAGAVLIGGISYLVYKTIKN